MAGSQGARKANERSARQSYAQKRAYLRAERFETLGFKSNEPTPNLSEGRAMAAGNLRRMSDRPHGHEYDMATPSMT